MTYDEWRSACVVENRPWSDRVWVGTQVVGTVSGKYRVVMPDGCSMPSKAETPEDAITDTIKYFDFHESNEWKMFFPEPQTPPPVLTQPAHVVASRAVSVTTTLRLEWERLTPTNRLRGVEDGYDLWAFPAFGVVKPCEFFTGASVELRSGVWTWRVGRKGDTAPTPLAAMEAAERAVGVGYDPLAIPFVPSL